MFSNICPLFMSISLNLVLPLALLTAVCGQTPKPAPMGAERAIKLAQSGHCEQALPALRRASQTAADKSTRRTAAFAGVRCAMLVNQTGAAVDFLQMLNRDFPGDPE